MSLSCMYEKGDHPGRMSSKDSELVHAVREVRNYGQVTYVTACNHWPAINWGWRHQPKDSTITCTNCQRALGMIESEPTNVRYVIYDHSTGLYLKTTGRKSIWVEESFAATRWRTKSTAKGYVKQIVDWHRKGKNTFEIKRGLLHLQF